MPDNPFGITQVDIPGIYGAVSNLRSSRIQQMLGQRQVEAADRQAERDNQVHSILAKAYGGAQAAQSMPAAPPAGGTSSPAPPTTPAPMPPTNGAMPAVTPQGLPGADPSGAVAPQGFRIPPELAQQLIAAGPEGQQMLHSINTMSDEQLASAQHRLQALAPLYAQAAHIPYAPDNGAARRAFIRSVIPEIQSMGIDPQQATNWDPTDQALNAHMSFGQTTNDALEAARSHLMVAPMNSDIINPEDIDPATHQPRVVYQSQFVGTPTEPYVRPPTMRQPSRPLTDAEIRQIDQGGPASAPGTFRQDGGAFDFHPTHR